MDLEVVFLGQSVGQVGDRTGVEGHGRATARADKMMAVDRRTGYVNRASRSVENPGKHPERGEDLQSAIDRRATTLSRAACRFGDQLLGRKGPIPPQGRSNDGATGTGHPVAVVGHGGDGLLRRVVSSGAPWERIAASGRIRHARSVAFPA